MNVNWGLDSRTGQPCPKCGSEIVYSGNYFCEHYEDGCDWAMGETKEDDKLFARCYPGLMANRDKSDKQRVKRLLR